MIHSREDLADHNVAHATRIHTRWQPAAKCLELNGVLLHQGTLPLAIPFQNCVLRLDQAVTPEQVVMQADAFFGGASSNPYTVITMSRQDVDLDAHLAGHGFTAQADLPAMLVASKVEMPRITPHWRVDLLSNTDEIPAFIDVAAKSFASLGLPAFLTPSYFVDPTGLLAPDIHIALARNEQGLTAACAMVMHTGDVAGVYWVGTLPEARGHGLAAACTAAVTNLALEHGAKAVTLQASHMGEATYKRLGYKEYGRLTRWVR